MYHSLRAHGEELKGNYVAVYLLSINVGLLHDKQLSSQTNKSYVAAFSHHLVFFWQISSEKYFEILQ